MAMACVCPCTRTCTCPSACRQIIGTNLVFYIMALVVGYAWYSNAQGETPDKVPVLSDAAAMQIGPM